MNGDNIKRGWHTEIFGNAQREQNPHQSRIYCGAGKISATAETFAYYAVGVLDSNTLRRVKCSSATPPPDQGEDLPPPPNVNDVH